MRSTVCTTPSRPVQATDAAAEPSNARAAPRSNRAALMAATHAAPIQRMNGLVFGGFDPMAELDAESSSSEEEAELDLDDMDFDDLTTPEFRRDHVMGAGDLYAAALQVGARRKKPVSTTVQFLSDDQDKTVAMMKAKIIAANRLNHAPNSLQNQTTPWKMLYAEVKPGKKGAYEVADVAFGKVRFAAQGVPTLGGTIYEINHLDGMADRSE